MALDLSIEHGIYCYYGRLGQGKTYAMVRDVIRALNTGQIVYTNFTLNWNGYDERKNPFNIFKNLIGFKRNFYVYPATNLRYLPTNENWHKEFAKTRDCIHAVDEAYVLFDSYQMTKMSMEIRMGILQTRKFDRSIWYTTQRPSAVHVVMRGMTNVFYRCEKWNTPFITLFARDEFDLANDETVDTENRLTRKLYTAQTKFFQMYNTKETIGLNGEINDAGKITENTEKYQKIYIKTKSMWGALAHHIYKKLANIK